MTAISFYLLAGLAIIAVLFLITIAAQLTRLEKSLAELTRTVETRVRDMYQNPKQVASDQRAAIDKNQNESPEESK